MEEQPVSKDHILLAFPPRLRNHIKEIWLDGKIGISSMNIKLHLCPTKVSPEEYGVVYSDNFVVEIPYGGKHLFWEIIFKDEDYNYPPDFEFNDDMFLCDPDINTISEFIPSLANWNADNPKALMCAIRELMRLYKLFQIMRLKSENGYSELYTEYELLQSQLSTSDSSEVYIDNNGTVHFLISLNIDFSSVPPYIQPILFGESDIILNPNEDTATLRVSFLKGDSLKVQSNLQLSPRLEQVIGNSATLHIPPYKKNIGLGEYVPQITKLLEDKVEQVSHHYKLKKEYISFLLTMSGCNIVEYDNTSFTKAVLLYEAENFYILVCINIGNKFPNEKPKVTLRSIYHLQYEKPFVQTLDNYPYSPRWKSEEMINRLLVDLQQEIPKFQIACQNVVQSIPT